MVFCASTEWQEQNLYRALYIQDEWRVARNFTMNIGGRYATFPGVVGTALTKVCGTEVARNVDLLITESAGNRLALLAQLRSDRGDAAEAECEVACTAWSISPCSSGCSRATRPARGPAQGSRRPGGRYAAGAGGWHSHRAAPHRGGADAGRRRARPAVSTRPRSRSPCPR